MRGWKWILTGVMTVAAVYAAFAASAKSRSFPENATPEEFARWQAQTREFLAWALFNGEAPKSVPLDARFGQREDHETYVIQELEFNDRPGHRVHGWIARPKNPAAARLPAVLALHGHNGSAYKVFRKGTYFYGDLLARKGYVVLAIDIHHRTLDPQGPYLDRGPLIRFKRITPMGQRVWMAMRAVDLLQTLPEVDPERIGVVGLSNGGLTTEFTAALDLRLKVAVASGALVMYDRWWAGDLTPCRCEYIPGLEGQLDYYDVFALVAPRPLLIQNGEQDDNFLIDSAKQAFAYIKKAYTIVGAPDKVVHDVFPGPHEFRPEAPISWFDKYLPLK
jgi:dienelactone hydrolase